MKHADLIRAVESIHRDAQTLAALETHPDTDTPVPAAEAAWYRLGQWQRRGYPAGAGEGRNTGVANPTATHALHPETFEQDRADLEHIIREAQALLAKASRIVARTRAVARTEYEGARCVNCKAFGDHWSDVYADDLCSWCWQVRHDFGRLPDAQLLYRHRNGRVSRTEIERRILETRETA